MSEVTLSAAAIARRSRSNLAFALFCLPPQRRRDMQTFYAFCRIVDDIADEPELAEEERAVGLQRWRDVVVGKAEDPDGLEASIFALTERYPISPDYLLEIIEGVSADLVKKRYQTFDELKLYCYRVACVVGLVSIEIFGYKNEGCRDYAVNLGYALQLTNILRDIGVDSKTSDRIYLPAEELERFGYGEKDLQRWAVSGTDEVPARPCQGLLRGGAGGASGRGPALDGFRGNDGADLFGYPGENACGRLPCFRKTLPAKRSRESLDLGEVALGTADVPLGSRCWSLGSSRPGKPRCFILRDRLTVEIRG